MSLDFVKALCEAKITPLERKVNELEEKVNAMGDTFEKIVDLVLKISDSFDEKVSELSNKLLSIEGNLSGVKSASNMTITPTAEKQERQVLPPPPNPEKKPLGEKSDRRALIDELKERLKDRG